jgi:hypothetical protein
VASIPRDVILQGLIAGLSWERMQELAGLANKEMPDDWVGSDEHNMLMTSRGGIPTDEFEGTYRYA